MRYGPPVAVIVATLTDPTPAWPDVPGGAFLSDVDRSGLVQQVLQDDRWYAALDGDRLMVAAPRGAGTEFTAYQVLFGLLGQPVPQQRQAEVPRERFTPRHRLRLAADPRDLVALDDWVQPVSPGLLRRFDEEGVVSGRAEPGPLGGARSLPAGPDEEGGSALLDAEWGLPAPSGARIVEHSEDPGDHYPLTLRPVDGAWWLDYATEVVDRVEVERLAARIEGASDSARIEHAAGDALLHEHLAASLAAGADAPAVEDGARTLTYRDLDRRSAGVAAALRRAGCGRGDLVGLHLARSADAVVALVGILRVGAAYVPLDPDFPEARRREVAERTALRAVVHRGAPFGSGADVDLADCPPVDLADWQPVVADDPLYVLFTSGSTGRPKGVLHTVGAVSRLVDYHRRLRSGPRPGSVLQFATLNFDVASQEILTALALGQRLVIASRAARQDPAELVDQLRAASVTEFFCPQVLLQEMCRAALRDRVALPALRHVYQSGEPLVMNTWLDRVLAANPAVTLHNQYGPTETHVITAWALPRRWRRPGPVALGPLATGSGGHVLGADLRPVAVGEVGELYAGEPQLARGYVADPRLTAARFVPDPAGGGGRVYRTGDLVTADAHGLLSFVGRADHQTKVRGHRVEPEEVTARLLELPEVDNAATFVTRTAAGENRLESVVVARDDVRDRALAHLCAELPEYLVPATLTVVDALARTATGKIDRSSLTVTPRGDNAPDLGPVGVVWAELLEVDPTADDDFLALGGSSITAIQMARRITEVAGVRVSVVDVVANPRLGDLAALVAERTAAGTGVGTPLWCTEPDPYAPFPLLDQQQAYLIGRDPEFDGGDVACHLYLEYSGEVDLPRLEAALARVVAHHPTLRTVFDTRTFTQRVLPAVPPVRIEEVTEDLAAVRARLSHEQRPFDEFPLFRAVLVRGGSGATLCLSLDALLVDARSIRQIVRDWERAYRGEPLDADCPTFRDYVQTVMRWREGEGKATYDRDREYWLERVPTLPAGPLLPTTTPPAGPPEFVNRRHVVPASRWSAVKAAAGRHGLTPTSVLVAAYVAAIAQWAEQPRFLLNVPRFGRREVHPAVDGIVGEFASFVLLDVDTASAGSFAGLAARVYRRLTEDLAHDELSGMEVLRELLRHRGALGSPAAPVVFTSELGVGDGIGTLFDGTLRQTYALSQTPQVWMDLLVGEEDGALVVRWDVLAGRFPEAVVDGMFALLTSQVHALADETAWEEAPLRAPAAVDRGLGDRPGAAVPFAVGAAWDGRVRTAEQQQAASLAVAAGVRAAVPDTDRRPIALALRPGADLAAAAHGVRATGRPYLPLDVDSPPGRIATLLDQVPVAGVLTDRTDVDWPCPVITAHGMSELDERPDTAAVLFTSGSTGVPKGVPVPEEGLRVCVAETIRMTGLTAADRSLALTRPHHDMSVFDLFVVPAAGGMVVYPPVERDPQRWAALVAEHRVTAVCAVPAAVEMLLDGADATGATLASLRIVLTGGDRVPPELVARLRRAAPGVRVWSIGGPTETTAWNIAYEVPADGPPAGWTTVPYGRPLAGTRYRVLDAEGRDRPERAVGELVVSGPGVLAGYLGRDAPRAPLVRDPVTGEIGYHTGDRGAFRDGLLEFHGRVDRQLEIRGQRVEPGEVEAVLREHPAVTGAVVVPLPGRTGLAAFVTGTVPTGELDVMLRDRLPRHLVPRTVEVLDALPLNRAGKTDVVTLTERAAAPRAGDTHSDDALVRLVCDVWAEQLGLAEVAPTASFFALGGDSMTAFKLVLALQEIFGSEVSLRNLLESECVEEFVDALRRRAGTASDTAGPGATSLDHIASVYLEVWREHAG